MTNIEYLQTPWSPLFFENITTEPINSKVEERRRAAQKLAKKEYDIVTENDRQESEILRRRDKARKEVEQKAKYLKAELLILSLNRPLTTGSLSPLQEFVGYTVPGYSTLMFADDASKHAQLAREAVKNKLWGPALGNAIKVPADVTMGAVSLIPFTGGISKMLDKLPSLKNFKNPKINWQNQLNEGVAEAFQNVMTPFQINKYGTVKYYGPTMGKTTAAKTNPRLVDFDDIVREEIQQLANKKGKSVRELKTESGIEYVLLLENAVSKWQANPANKDKTLLISNSALSNKPIFDNTPVIPSKDLFIARQVARGESDPTYAALYYDDLLKRNPLLKIDDSFVSEIESGTRSAKISESERLGIPKGERTSYSQGSNADPSYYVGIGLKNLKYLLALRDYHFSVKAPNSKTTGIYNNDSRYGNDFFHFDRNKIIGFGNFTDPETGKVIKAMFNPYTGEKIGVMNPDYRGFFFRPTVGENAKLIEGGRNFKLNIQNPRYTISTGDLELSGTLSDPQYMPIRNDGVITRVPALNNDIFEVLVRNPEQIKLSDPITYDNNEIIPLSKRDNFTNSDIRYLSGGELNYLNYIK